MGGILSLIGLAILASLFVSAIIAFTALRRTGRLERRVVSLAARLELLEAGRTQTDTPSQKASDSKEETRPAAPEKTPLPTRAKVPERDEPANRLPPPRAARSTVPPVTRKTGQSTAAAAQGATIEETIASRWLVWLGGITIALAGVFLIRYGIDHNLLTPAVRVFAGGVLGVALVVGGEWLRRRPLNQSIANVEPDHVPTALTGAGVSVVFGSIYGAYALYDLLAPIVVFALLSATAFAALALSLLQGPFIAALGVAGAFAIPLLVKTDAPSAWSLFTFLFFVSASAMAVARYRNWRWLAGSAVAGSSVWALVWLTAMWRPDDLMPITLHMLAVLAMAVATRFEALISGNDSLRSLFNIERMTAPERLVVGAAVAVTLVVFVLVRVDGYAIGSLTVFGLVAGLLLVGAFKIKSPEGLLPIAAVATIVLLVIWHQPSLFEAPETLTLQGQEIGRLPAPVVPPEFSAFVSVALIVSLVYGVVGFAGLNRATTPAVWAGVSAYIPLAVLMIVYWRLNFIGVDLAWAAAAVALAASQTLAASKLVGMRRTEGMESPLGLYALAVIASLTLAVTMTLEKTWLTITLSFFLPAMAWVHGRLRISYLRPASFAIAAVVTVRLLLLHHLPGSPFNTPLDATWILYSYGLPAASFALTAHWYREVADDHLVSVLESAAIAVGVATVSMEIRWFVGDGSLGYERYTLFEQSLHSLSWLATGYALYRRHRIAPRAVSLWAGRILIGLAALQVFGLQVFLSNPVLTGEDMGAWPVINKLTLAYVVPALFAIAIHWEAIQQGNHKAATWAGAAVFLLLFTHLSLEVRHLFHGRVLHSGAITDAEGYSYSAVWLTYAGVLLAIGILWRIVALRQAALGLVLLVVAKVFLWDMSWLEGLYRVASFLGLGLSLVGIGYLYRRFVTNGETVDEAKGSFREP